MAKHISFGDAVNEAERWAFKLLAEELPVDYVLLTNIEIPTHSGQALEVDALIIGDWGIYVVDVKGYIGRLEAGQHAWSLDGREVDNSLAKANYVARVLAGKIKHKIPVGVYSPWVQGMVFLTGRKGQEISLDKMDDQLSIYTPEKIVSALTKEWGLTAPKKFPVTARQKDHVLETLGQVTIVEQRNNRIQDFTKQKCLFIQQGLEIWQAEYNPGGWTALWLLKLLDVSAFDSKDQHYTHEQKLRDEFFRLQKLAGCAGVPYCAPLIQDGERLVLPIKMPRGVPLSIFKPADHSTYQLLEVLRQSAAALQHIHRRGFTVGNWSENCIFACDEGDIEFIDISNDLTMDDDIHQYACRFLELAKATRQPRIVHWYKVASGGHHLDLDALRCDLSAVIEQGVCDGFEQQVIIETETIIDHHFQLKRCIAKTERSQLWLAEYLQGQFDCALSIYHGADQHWPRISHLYRSLARIYHPHIERALSFGQLPGSSDLYISRIWIKGGSIDETDSFTPEQVRMWLAQILTGLQYLHRMDIFHGAICPRNIICNPVRAVLVNFGVGLDIAAESYSRQYADPDLWAEESEQEKDLYGLVASFIDVFSPDPKADLVSRETIFEQLDAMHPDVFDDALYDGCSQILKFQWTSSAENNYLHLFGLEKPV